MTLDASDTADLLRIARDTAIAAGQLALQRRREGVEVAATKSTPIDIVTAADRETEELIRGMLLDARPDDGFLGEESGEGYGTSGLTWVVDPIDGTVNYLYDIPGWAVSIAVVEGEPDPTTWTPIAGAVVNPVTGEAYTASAGGGAHVNGRPLTVGDGVPLDRALVGTGYAYSLDVREEQIEVSGRLLREVRDIRRMGAASLDLCAVATGRLDAYFEWGLNPWDMAAGALVAAEAGAVVLGPRGGAASKELLVTGASSVARPLLEKIESWRRATS